MTGIDIGILVLLLAFVCYGWKMGFVHTAAGIFGALISIFIAMRLYEPFVHSPFGRFVGGDTNLGKIIAFAVVYIVLEKVIGLVIWVIDRVANFLSAIPLVEGANKLVGSVLGLVEGLIVIAGIVYVAGKYPVAQQFGVNLADSHIAGTMNTVVRVFEPLFPQWIGELRSVFDVPADKAAEYIREYFKF